MLDFRATNDFYCMVLCENGKPYFFDQLNRFPFYLDAVRFYYQFVRDCVIPSAVDNLSIWVLPVGDFDAFNGCFGTYDYDFECQDTLSNFGICLFENGVFITYEEFEEK